MSDFGDFDEDDALDTEPADPEQVAIKFHRYIRDDEPEVIPWAHLTQEQRAMAIRRIVRLLAWLRRQGAFR